MAEDTLPSWDETEEVLPDWDSTSEISSEPKEVPSSTVMSRAAAQGFTMGLGDEGEGVFGSLLELLPGSASRADEELRKQGFTVPDTTSYEAIRDQVRRENKEADKANPTLYGATEFVSGVVSPTNYILPASGLLKAGAGAGKVTKALLPVADLAATGALSGAVSSFGTSEAATPVDLAKDIAVGTGIGAVAGPVVGGAVHLGTKAAKATATGIKNAGNWLLDAVPSLKNAFEQGRLNVNKNFDSFKAETIDRLNKVQGKIVDFYENRKNVTEAERDALVKEVEEVTSQINKETSDLNKIKSLQTQQAKEIDNVQKQALDLEKANEAKLKDLQKLEVEKAQAKERAINEERLNRRNALKNELNSEKEKLRVLNEDTNLEMKQKEFDQIVQSSEKIEGLLKQQRSDLSAEYTDIGKDLELNGVNLDTREFTDFYRSFLGNDKISPTTQAKMSETFDSLLVPYMESGNGVVSLAQFKDLVGRVRRLANNPMNTPSEQHIAKNFNKDLNSYLESKLKDIDPALADRLKIADRDWKGLLETEDLVKDSADRVTNFIKGIRRSEAGTLDPNAIRNAKQAEQLLQGTQNPQAKTSAESILEELKMLQDTNKNRIDTKQTNREVIKSSKRVSELEDAIEDLRNPIKLDPESPTLTDDMVSNNKDIEELLKIKDDLINQKSKTTDDEVLKLTEIDRLNNLLQEKQQLQKQFEQNQRRRVETDALAQFEATPQVSKQKDARRMSLSLNADDLSERGMVNKQFLDPVKAQDSSLGKETDELSKILDIFKTNPEIDTGSLSNRAITAKLATPVSYKAGQAVEKFSRSSVGKLIQKSGGIGSKYGKMLTEALTKGDGAVNSTIYQLQQTDSSFRKLIKDSMDEDK